MNYLLTIACLVGCLAWAQGMPSSEAFVTNVLPDQMTTTTPRPHHESSETDGFQFSYDGVTKMMLVLNTQNCYIWPVTADEMSMVHTNDGMRAIELRVFKEIDARYYTKVPMNILGTSITKGCRGSHHHTHAMLRVLKEVDDAFYTKLPENVLAPTIARGCKNAYFNHGHKMTYYLVH